MKIILKNNQKAYKYIVPNFRVILSKMFFRIKKIKGKEYVYIVENEWKTTAKLVGTLRGTKPKGSRQKVISYIGKSYRFELLNDIDFLQFMRIEDLQGYIQNNHKNQIIHDLIEWEFFRFGVSKKEFSIDLNNLKIQKNKKNVTFLINDGFLCNITLRNLINFKTAGDEQNDGYRLARAFVEAGIKVSQEVFIGLFGKLYKVK